MRWLPRALLGAAVVGVIALWISPVFAAAVSLEPAGDWRVKVTVPAEGDKPGATATIDVPGPTLVTVTAEKHDALPVFRAESWGGWQRGAQLRGVVAEECTTPDLLEPTSLEVREGPEPASRLFERDKDYAADLRWGSIGRLPNGRIGERQPVYVSYRHAMLRLDSIVRDAAGKIVLRPGTPKAAAPLPAALQPGDRRLGNIWVAGRLAKLGPEHLFPILEEFYPEPPKSSPTPAEKLLPKTMRKLQEGQPLRILAWGDSVTVGTYLPEPERWQAQFVARLRQRFPKAQIELITEAWGGRNTASYLAEPAGSPHNYQEKVLGSKPDLVVSEFVNDAGLTSAQVEERYGKLRADFQAIGAEWIILTPHYVRPDWMGLSREREIDDDPRPYVSGLRQFAAKHSVALADASLRYGRLWRQGIPYTTLMVNSINHPDARGMKLFADSLMALFP
ncbi:MAG: SGNH/GDSL hydrolase family protein [Thermoguttaceae bacterium]|jgi:lysophospholipase L1-like esterase|nr:SGNH/GDSL hydrolase family protein [Thermoguttaceae bacterium]